MKYPLYYLRKKSSLSTEKLREILIGQTYELGLIKYYRFFKYYSALSLGVNYDAGILTFLGWSFKRGLTKTETEDNDCTSQICL